MNFKNLLIISFAFIILFSCDKKSENCNATYFGGQIVNPRQNFVTLSKNDVVLDTMYLDDNNNFITQLDLKEEGLYSFNHFLEYQYFYIEPMDSILIRLNTWDFDESLVFSGRGSEKNNFLISLYLQNEKNEYSFIPYFNLESDNFETKIANAQSLNNYLYDQLKESGVEISQKFDELAFVAINYPLYRKKEMYSWRYNSRNKNEKKPELPSIFFDYKERIDLNNNFLSSYAPYHNFISTYLYGLALNNDSDYNVNFIKNRLNVILENIKIEKTKNMLLYQALYNDFRRNKYSCSIDTEGLKIFMENCTDENYIKQINALVEDCEKIAHNTSIDNFEIKDSNNNHLKINSIINNKDVVIYFWSPEIISPKMLIKRVKYLESKFPKLLFIGINTNPSPLSQSVNHQLGNQYFLTKESSAHNFVRSLEPRTILVDKKGIVLNSFTYLSSAYLEKQLSELEGI